MKSKIIKLVEILNDSIDDNNKIFIKRHNNSTNQLLLRDIFYVSMKLVNSSSYAVSNSYLKIDAKKKVSIQAINKRRLSMDPILFDNIYNTILHKLYEPHKNTKYPNRRLI